MNSGSALKLGLFLQLMIASLLFNEIENRSISAPAVVDAFVAKVSKVIDGDTIILSGLDNAIRLWGVDAPEMDEEGFRAAKDALSSAVSNGDILCHQVDTDHYNRIVARCYSISEKFEINRYLIQAGVAEEYRYFTNGFYEND
ncbi:MAG: thermonuclease family protein [Pseudomonadota bacterium]